MKLFTKVALLSVFLCTCASPIVKKDGLAPLYNYPNSVENEWFITFKDPGNYNFASHFTTIEEAFRFDYFSIGYYTKGITAAQMDNICADPNVKCVEPETKTPSKYHARVLQNDRSPDNSHASNAITSQEIYELQAGAEERGVGYALNHLSAIKKFPTDSSYSYQEEGGRGVDVYVIDSGVNKIPAEFEERVENYINTSSDYAWGESKCNPDGHGTPVASVVAGRTFGVA